MNEFLQDLLNPGWWIGVVLISFLINLASSYVKPRIDQLAGRLSKRRRLANEKAKQLFEKQVSELINDPTGTKVIRLQLANTENTIRFLVYLLLAFSFMTIAYLFRFISYDTLPSAASLPQVITIRAFTYFCMAAAGLVLIFSLSVRVQLTRARNIIREYDERAATKANQT